MNFGHLVGKFDIGKHADIQDAVFDHVVGCVLHRHVYASPQICVLHTH